MKVYNQLVNTFFIMSITSGYTISVVVYRTLKKYTEFIPTCTKSLNDNKHDFLVCIVAERSSLIFFKHRIRSNHQKRPAESCSVLCICNRRLWYYCKFTCIEQVDLSNISVAKYRKQQVWSSPMLCMKVLQILEIVVISFRLYLIILHMRQSVDQSVGHIILWHKFEIRSWW